MLSQDNAKVTHSHSGTARHSWHEIRHLFAVSPARRGLRVHFGRNWVPFGEVSWKRERWRCCWEPSLLLLPLPSCRWCGFTPSLEIRDNSCGCTQLAPGPQALC